MLENKFYGSLWDGRVDLEPNGAELHLSDLSEHARM